VEAAEQLGRAVDQIAALPGTPALRREQIKAQVALINTLMHVKGYAAPETKAAVERARLLIEQADALGEPPEDPQLLFSVLYGSWIANLSAFNGDALRELAAQFLMLAEKHGTTASLLIAHRLKGISLLLTGDVAQARAHQDRAIALYDPAAHGPLATRFGINPGVSVFAHRSWARWLLGYPDAALADADQALSSARKTDHAATLMYALALTDFIQIFCGNYAAARAQADELMSLAVEKDAVLLRGGSNFDPRLDFGSNRQSRGCSPDHRVRN
jgi:hypothetical protein